MEIVKIENQVSYHSVGNVEDFPLHLGKVVHIEGGPEIAVFRVAERTLYALENRTGHKKGGPLAEGLVSGEYVYCPLRDCKISLLTGEVQLPDTGRVSVYPLRLDGDVVLVGERAANEASEG
ncbi:nitrite reductase (NAD(P)H) small subunit [Paenibacillus hexagrammi]|uniref:Nitrite reductase (NAD(P)H) small subunit n=1 Tax=Paenibacillus hexagrammi TaxID=2908839 RepID=A0ABY3SLI4_9BACL|nr:nitrite reductase (NAD(P)H) small subunit [Paenibacillus sp. YPD9-1]UJF33822.1 nitrite reductase (NAD(P)H) small subunit [Paenibacillus sp. YPD9-1]